MSIHQQSVNSADLLGSQLLLRCRVTSSNRMVANIGGVSDFLAIRVSCGDFLVRVTCLCGTSGHI
jgi:hypothetical protein